MLNTLFNSLRHIFYPHCCLHCDTVYLNNSQILCISCLHNFPFANLENVKDNNIEKIFWGRLPLQHAFTLSYFTKGGMIQKLIHQLKYKGNLDAGILIGKLMGKAIENSSFYTGLDGVIALPLHPLKLAKRGFNQADIIAENIAEELKIVHFKNILKRNKNTSTQTAKNRAERLHNMLNVFDVIDFDTLQNKKVLLVDDILTTGATLEACGLKLLQINGLQLYIASAAYSSTI
jgi:ComF family protein